MTDEKKELPIIIPDDVLKGTYSNSITIRHTQGEFLLDCMTVFSPKGIVGARVIISPGHAKRLLKALGENIVRYEKMFGKIPEESPPPSVPMN
ncbi:MAG: hypothetical protein A2W61_04075 [Deltaproteobacteria bacterium RIFCSPLOWO2_01_44_7]|nr:MAG: hypothetical protein A2712_07245 [Deltaproteobacteria bacterium RIFCSPHIGHO2_01_FULL_43_49]OGQ15740.1 MAG: hypothetical protein A3D22_06035 [Deltaproteobacteria bacterium RIFCSPHIGHO2_02_FULL_44_53]OGQ28709.1 MAG: hypothetical protein A3D98_00770 [Deltaproteobacteria bacterium RIFCSPHIGHO2_12_FULL_44_21]OGQ32032.1 MAG: hypothetical protein A2979_02980 [Deltaproteobacteria bacterium RIFCSPLOWO2_01_FULL_45_74]OGQ39567.1 MAG: hypothetical protein A2W61_04075 [Deltaproteobacteria bacterium 